MKNTITFLLLLLVSVVSAQNYQMIFPERTMYYRFTSYFEGQVNAVIVDSIEMSESQIDYLFRPQLDNLHYEHDTNYTSHCVNVFGASVMGYKMSLMDTLTVFYNRDSVPIFIKPMAEPGESWLCYAHNGDTINATVDSVYSDTIFADIVDTVKRISLDYPKAFPTVGDGSDSQYYLLLSKNYGAVKLYNFRHFPNLISNSDAYGVITELISLELIGLHNPSIGVQNLTWKEINNYNVGDVFHDSVYSYDSWHTERYTRTTTSIRRVISKHIIGNKIEYKFKRYREYLYQDYNDSTLNSFKIDTIKLVIGDSATFDHEPGYYNLFIYKYPEIVYTGFIQSNLYSMNDVVYKKIGYSGGFYEDSIDCPPLVDEWGLISRTGPLYTRGLGMYIFSSEHSETEGSSRYLNQLVYYKKGATEWGTPLNMDTLQAVDAINYKTHNTLSIFPNPAGSKVYFKGLNSSANVRIFDLSAKLVKKEALHDNQLELEDLPKGIYIIELRRNNGMIYRGKLIKK